MHFAFFIGRRNRHDFFNSRRFGNTGSVDHRGNQRSGSAGDVNPDAFHRLKAFTQRNTGADNFFPRLGNTQTGKSLHIFQRSFDSAFFFTAETFCRLSDFIVSYFELSGREFYFIKFQCVTHQSLIAFLADSINHSAHRFFYTGRITGAVVDDLQLLSKVRLAVIKRLHKNSLFLIKL